MATGWWDAASASEAAPVQPLNVKSSYRSSPLLKQCMLGPGQQSDSESTYVPSKASADGTLHQAASC